MSPGMAYRPAPLMVVVPRGPESAGRTKAIKSATNPISACINWAVRTLTRVTFWIKTSAGMSPRAAATTFFLEKFGAIIKSFLLCRIEKDDREHIRLHHQVVGDKR